MVDLLLNQVLQGWQEEMEPQLQVKRCQDGIETFSLSLQTIPSNTLGIVCAMGVWQSMGPISFTTRLIAIHF